MGTHKNERSYSEVVTTLIYIGTIMNFELKHENLVK